jgi:hypothetical protein
MSCCRRLYHFYRFRRYRCLYHYHCCFHLFRLHCQQVTTFGQLSQAVELLSDGTVSIVRYEYLDEDRSSRMMVTSEGNLKEQVPGEAPI